MESKKSPSLNESCYKKCKEYSYWWSFKAVLERQTFDIKDCVHKCCNDMTRQNIKVGIPS